MFETLLPENASAAEKQLEQVNAMRYDVSLSIRNLWNPNTCPVPALPWLAWALSVEPWDKDWPEARQRAVIKAAIPIHRIKGTVAAVRQTLAAAGFPEAQVIEKLHRAKYDGRITYNGHYTYGDPKAWANYRIVLSQPITNTQSKLVRRLLDESDRATSKLVGLDFTAVANTYNGASKYDGKYNHGAA